MNKTLKALIALMLVGNVTNVYCQQNDELLQLLKQELAHNMKELQKQELPPYYMSYRVIDRDAHALSSSFGVIQNDQQSRSQTMIPHIRIGDKEFDNFKDFPFGSNRNTQATLPCDGVDIADAVRQSIWDETNNRYQFALQIFKDSKIKKSVSVENTDKSPAFSDAKVESHYEEFPKPIDFNREGWGKRLNEITALFNEDPNMIVGVSSLSYMSERRYFVDTEGREIVQNLPYVRLMVSGQIKAVDGMELPLNLSYFAYDLKDLPTQDSILSDTKRIIAKLKELREAPLCDPYTGPAILSGAASGVFFHEIFGHRIEGQRMKTDNDGQTFKQMVGKQVLPLAMSVYDDPTRRNYNGEALNGFYMFDDQGVRAEPVTVVKDGLLHEFLMTRTPLDGHSKSNGHSRGEQGLDGVSRQSNLIIETNDHKSERELRQLLIEEAKRQGKEYGYFFKEVTGGLTFTGKGSINSFNVNPLEVYMIYVDGRPDQLVRGADLIGTPLSMFSNIIHAGGRSQVFTGMCGAESGSIPVTAISPMILVNKIETQRRPKSQDIPPILAVPTVQ